MLIKNPNPNPNPNPGSRRVSVCQGTAVSLLITMRLGAWVDLFPYERKNPESRTPEKHGNFQTPKWKNPDRKKALGNFQTPNQISPNEKPKLPNPQTHWIGPQIDGDSEDTPSRRRGVPPPSPPTPFFAGILPSRSLLSRRGTYHVQAFVCPFGGWRLVGMKLVVVVVVTLV